MTKGKLQKKGYDYKPEFDQLQPIGEYGLDAVPQAAHYSADFDVPEIHGPWKDGGRAFDAGRFTDTVGIWHGYNINTLPLHGPYHATEETGRTFSEIRKSPIDKGFTYDAPRVRNSWDAQRIDRRGYDLATLGIVLNTLPHPCVVVDYDSHDLLDDVLLWFGETPLHVKSLRGGHLIYANPIGVKSLSQSQGAEKIDIKASGHICAPLSPFNRFGGRYEWINRPEGLTDFEALKAFAALLAGGELPALHLPALKRFFPDIYDSEAATVPSFTPDTKTITPASFKAPTERPTVKANQNHESFKPSKGTAKGRGRNNDLLSVALHIAKRHPIGPTPPQCYLAQVQQHNALTYSPPLDTKEAARVAVSAWVNYHAKGKNFAGNKRAGREAVTTERVKAAMLAAHKGYASMITKRVIPLYEALQRQHAADANFDIHKNFIKKVTGATKCNQLCNYKRILIDAGLIEAVPLSELGVKTRYAFNQKDADGNPIKGRCEKFRFTAFARMEQGPTIHVEDMRQACADLLQNTANSFEAITTDKKLTERRKVHGKRNRAFLREVARDYEKAALVS